MIRIEIGARNCVLHLILPHPLKIVLLSPASREGLDRINRAFNETVYSGEGATAYDRIHRYAEGLCRPGGFVDVRIPGYWIPGSSRLVPDAEWRFRLERGLERLPLWRHAAAVLAVEARRSGRAV